MNLPTIRETILSALHGALQTQAASVLRAAKPCLNGFPQPAS